MNKLLTNINGGFPYKLDDLRFLDDAQREALKGLVKALIGDATFAILVGCEQSEPVQGTWHINEGYIFFNDEIFYAPAQDINAITAGGYYWQEKITYDSAGDKAFEVDGVVHQTYQIRQAELVFSETEQAVPMLAPDIVTILRNRLGVEANGAWTSVALSASNVTINNGSIASQAGTLRYKVMGKTFFAQINLYVQVSTSLSNSTVIKVALPGTITPKDLTKETISMGYNTTNPANDRLFPFTVGYSNTNVIGIAMLERDAAIPAAVYNFIGEIFFEIA